MKNDSTDETQTAEQQARDLKIGLSYLVSEAESRARSRFTSRALLAELERLRAIEQRAEAMARGSLTSQKVRAARYILTGEHPS